MRLSFLISTASISLKTCFRQKSHRHVADLLDLSRHVEIDLSCRRSGPRLFWSLTCLRHVGDLLKTCRRPGFKQVLSKIDVMEFGHYLPDDMKNSRSGVETADSTRVVMWYVGGGVAPLGSRSAGRTSPSAPVDGGHAERVGGTGRHGQSQNTSRTRTTRRARRLRHTPAVAVERRPVLDDVMSDGHVTLVT